MPPVKPLLRALGSTDEAGDAVRQVIRAYHGSPYDFDRFDASKIGTGEGAQSYGYGLYFAGNQDVANAYRRNLTEQPGAGIVLYQDEAGRRLPTDLIYKLEDDRFARKWGPEGAPDAARRLAAEFRATADAMRGKGLGGFEVNWWQQSADQLERFASNGLRPPGRTYEVEIAYPEDAFLDWDASLSRQPAAVQAYAGRGGSYHGLIGQPGDGRRFWWNRRMSSTEAEAAKELLENGIPGIKYYDAGSRRTGAGTRNYVVFPGAEDQIRILRKYGLMAPIPAAAALGGGTEE